MTPEPALSLMLEGAGSTVITQGFAVTSLCVRTLTMAVPGFRPLMTPVVAFSEIALLLVFWSKK